MANKIYQDRFVASITSALREAENAQRVGHHGLAGRYRELLLEKILQPLVGPKFGFGSGKVVDSTGCASPEVDLIVYRRDSIPPILWSGREGVFPIEACCYAIEVKSRLTSSGVKDTIANARKLLGLKERRLSLGNELKATEIPIVLFAFESQIDKMVGVINHIERHDKEWRTSPVLNVVCIASLGYMAFDRNIGSWVGERANPDVRHIVDFAVGIGNTLLNWSDQDADFALGPYLTDVKYGDTDSTVFD